MERNARTSLQGVVTSTKMNKTIVVEVETHKRHAKYAKRVKYSSKYYAHDEKNEAKVGDVVTIMGCRPLSATKRFRLVEIVEKAVIYQGSSDFSGSVKYYNASKFLCNLESIKHNLVVTMYPIPVSKLVYFILGSFGFGTGSSTYLK